MESQSLASESHICYSGHLVPKQSMFTAGLGLTPLPNSSIISDTWEPYYFQSELWCILYELGTTKLWYYIYHFWDKREKILRKLLFPEHPIICVTSALGTRVTHLFLITYTKYASWNLFCLLYLLFAFSLVLALNHKLPKSLQFKICLLFFCNSPKSLGECLACKEPLINHGW